MSLYIAVRIVRMDNVDIGLFEHDRHNTLYFYLLNSDEQIYMRYGGRDSASPETYLNLASLEVALAKGLELHERYKKGDLAQTPRPAPDFPKNYPMLVERTFARGQCVECHLIGDFQNMHREKDNTLDKLRDLYRSPDIKVLGIHLDVPKGLVVKETKGAAAEAGIQPGDAIKAVNGKTVYTFADLQHQYDKLDRRTSTEVRFTVERGHAPPRELAVKLPARWWYYDARYRQSSVDPRLYFESRPLSEDEKRKHGLAVDGFASEVTRVDSFATMMKSHQLQEGDIVFAVDSVERNPYAHTADVYMKLKQTPGDVVKLSLLRNGQRLESSLTTYRMSFRK